MHSSRVFRLFEGSLVVLFLIQALRFVMGTLLAMISRAIAASHADIQIVYPHIVLVVALIPVWFSPKTRTTLPLMLVLSASTCAAARVLMAVFSSSGSVALYSGLVVISAAGVYLASLLRANWTSWVNAIVAGITFDQFFRAPDFFDLSLQASFNLTLGELRYRIPWIIAQMVLGLVLVVAALLARRNAPREAYQPAYLRPFGGVSLGALLMLEMTLLAMPNAVARWTNVSAGGLVPWLVVASVLPLIAAVRKAIDGALSFVDTRSQGWIYLFFLLLLLLIGVRLGSPGAAGALVVAQFVAILGLWSLPLELDPAELEEVGPSVGLAGLVLVLLTYAYSMTFEEIRLLAWMHRQSLMVFLLAGALLGMSRLWASEAVSRSSPPHTSGALTGAFVLPAIVLSLLLTSAGSNYTMPEVGSSIRVATYNINGGFDAEGNHQLEQLAATIQASLADVVVLHEVDAGRPLAFGADSVEFLGRRLHMYRVYAPGEKQIVGIAVLSKLPIVSYESVLLPSTGDSPAAIQVVVEDPTLNRQVRIVGAQIEAGPDEMRLTQLNVLAGLMGEEASVMLGAGIVGEPGDIVYQQLMARNFVDPDQVLGIERGFTFPSDFPTLRHDYLFARGYLPLSALQVQSQASDHRLVVVEFAWR